jgi:hypothetical protein
LSPDGETESFQILAGVLQGDTLAPYLFIIALDYALKRAIDGKEEELGFTVIPRKSRRIGPVTKTDFDFADDIALVSNTAEQAQALLHRVEVECRKIGLRLNAKKTEIMSYNTGAPKIKTLDETVLTTVEDFKYLGSHLRDTKDDIKVRKALAWQALHSMKRIWKSSLNQEIKRRLFIVTVETVLLYGCEAWTLTTREENRLDGSYTRMLRMALNVSWKDKISNETLYGNIPRLTEKIRERRLRLAGHCVRHSELEASNLVLWEPSQGRPNRGRAQLSFLDMLRRDTGLQSSLEIRTLMQDRSRWHAMARGNST